MAVIKNLSGELWIPNDLPIYFSSKCNFNTKLSGETNSFKVELQISDPTKFFGCELGAQTQFDHKNDRYIVNGSHDAAKLQDLLFTFIDK